MLSNIKQDYIIKEINKISQILRSSLMFSYLDAKRARCIFIRQIDIFN